MKHIAFQALASKKLGGSKTRFLWQDHATHATTKCSGRFKSHSRTKCGGRCPKGI